MGLISLILRVLSAIILFLLAFEVIEGANFFLWLAAAIGIYVTATIFGDARVNASGWIVNTGRERD